MHVVALQVRPHCTFLCPHTAAHACPSKRRKHLRRCAKGLCNTWRCIYIHMYIHINAYAHECNTSTRITAIPRQVRLNVHARGMIE